jgi:anthranilate synthase component 1
MPQPAPNAPDVAAVQRRLPAQADPFALYDALSGGGSKADTALFERTDGTTLLMQRAAVRVKCRGESVSLTAQSSNGEALLGLLQERLEGKVRSAAPGRLVLHFPSNDSLDAEARLLAPSPLHALRPLIRLATSAGDPPFTVTALGILAFDYAALAEKLPDNPEDPLGFPDYVFWIPDAAILFEPGALPRVICTAFAGTDPLAQRRNYHDAVERLGALVEACASVRDTPSPVPPARPASTEVDLDDEAYCEVVRRLRKEIARGEIYQIVPSRTFRTPCSNPLRAYGALRQAESSPYRFFVNGGDFVLFGASPETSVRIFRADAATKVEVRPIAGTRPRGATSDEDDRLEAEMRLDAKEAAEHMMLTERTKRGPYGGAIGWVNGEGMMDSAVVIRSAVVRDGLAYVRAGAGVVYDSDPQAEADETRRKASALLSILAAAEAAQ